MKMKIKQMKYIQIIAFVCVSMLSIAQGPFLLDKVIAKVGSEYILLSELEGQYAYLKESNSEITEEAKCEIMENLIAQKIIVYQAKLDSIEISDDALEAQLDYRFQSILRQMNGDEEFFQTYYGATISEMKERYRENQLQQMLSERMQQKLISEVDITPKEVKDFFEQIPTDSLPYLNSEVEVSELVIKPQINNEERQKALGTAAAAPSPPASARATRRLCMVAFLLSLSLRGYCLPHGPPRRGGRFRICLNPRPSRARRPFFFAPVA